MVLVYTCVLTAEDGELGIYYHWGELLSFVYGTILMVVSTRISRRFNYSLY